MDRVSKLGKDLRCLAQKLIRRFYEKKPNSEIWKEKEG